MTTPSLRNFHMCSLPINSYIFSFLTWQDKRKTTRTCKLFKQITMGMWLKSRGVLDQRELAQLCIREEPSYENSRRNLLEATAMLTDKLLDSCHTVKLELHKDEIDSCLESRVLSYDLNYKCFAKRGSLPRVRKLEITFSQTKESIPSRMIKLIKLIFSKCMNTESLVLIRPPFAIDVSQFKLKSLSIHGPVSTDDATQLVSSINKISTLEFLSFIDFDFIENEIDSNKLGLVRELFVTPPQIGLSFEKICKFRELRSLIFGSGCCAEFSHTNYLIPMIKSFPKLEILKFENFTRQEGSQHGESCLSALPYLTNLRVLSLGNCGIIMEDLTPLIKCPSLESLEILFPFITLKGYEIISQIPKLKSLIVKGHITKEEYEVLKKSPTLVDIRVIRNRPTILPRKRCWMDYCTVLS